MKQPSITYSGAKLDPLYPIDGASLAAPFAANLTVPMGTVVGQVSSANADEKQSLSLTGSPTGLGFTLMFNGQSTSRLGFTATASQVQAALQALTTIGVGNVTCTGGPINSSSITIEFTGDCGNNAQPLIVAIPSTFSENYTIAVSRIQAGVANSKWAPYVASNTDGTQIAKGILAIDVQTDQFGKNQYAGGLHPMPSVPVYYAGCFHTTSLFGLDSGAVSQLGRLISGVLADGILKLS
ncbi:MAG: hypothetical protein JSS72_01860 [Armatimonadetes bacterium]|nr:hypothetical protein [Armatimonadota bacterium]